MWVDNISEATIFQNLDDYQKTADTIIPKNGIKSISPWPVSGDFSKLNDGFFIRAALESDVWCGEYSFWKES